MPKQVPSVGRVVHFVSEYHGKHVPADICEVHTDGRCTLFVKDHILVSSYFRYNVIHDETAIPETFHFPEYVPAKEEPVIQPPVQPAA